MLLSRIVPSHCVLSTGMVRAGIEALPHTANPAVIPIIKPQARLRFPILSPGTYHYLILFWYFFNYSGMIDKETAGYFPGVKVEGRSVYGTAETYFSY